MSTTENVLDETLNTSEEVEANESTNETQDEINDEEELVSADYKKRYLAAERQIKELKKASTPTEQPTPKTEAKTEATQGMSTEDFFVLKQLDSMDELEDAKLIVARKQNQGIEISLQESLTTPEFKALKEVRKKEQEIKMAQAPSSKRAKGIEVKTLQTPNLTREEHKRLTEEFMAKRR